MRLAPSPHFSPWGRSSAAYVASTRGLQAPRSLTGARATHRRNACAGGVRTPGKAMSELGDRAAGRRDLLLRRGGERVRADLHRRRDGPVAENLHRLARADRAAGGQVGRGDRAAVGEQLADPVEVDDLVLHLERVLE